jgi:hypothetical protein
MEEQRMKLEPTVSVRPPRTSDNTPREEPKEDTADLTQFFGNDGSKENPK